MGVVYLAEDQRLKRRVALKLLPPVVAGNATLRERLRREAQAAATISHPAVAIVYALEEIDGQLLLVSEYIPGRTLREEIARGALAPERALDIARDIAKALSAAHDAGVIHRDLKPENVLITQGGAVKVVDFGIAHVEGALLGTPAYMAPEQLAGDRVDARFGSARELAQAVEHATKASGSAPRNTARWWWEFHQGLVALTYWLMVIPAWSTRGLIGGLAGRVFFVLTLGAVIVGANLRLHLWFTSRFYPAELRWLRTRVARWMHAADWIFAIALVTGSLMVGDGGSPLAILLLSFGGGAAVAFLFIEPATTRAACRTSSTRDLFAFALVVALCGGALAACNRPAQEEDTDAGNDNVVPVGAQAVQAGRIRAVIHATGIVTPAQGAEFLAVAPEPARIADITKAEGEPVTSGELLVRFDVPSANEDAARQRADVARAQALFESAGVAQRRSRELLERGIISRREMEDADREYANAQAEVARAERARAAADAAVARSIVRAPFNGIVIARLHNPGDLVQGTVADPVLRVVDPRRLEVTVTVPAADTSRVLPGATARLAAAADSVPVRLNVASRSPVGTGDVSVRLTFAEPTTLAVETPVEVDIDAEERVNVVLISPNALVGEGANRAVFVAVGNRAERRLVMTGIIAEERVEITAGLKPGELLITRGHTGLIDGATISVAIEAP